MSKAYWDSKAGNSFLILKDEGDWRDHFSVPADFALVSPLSDRVILFRDSKGSELLCDPNNGALLDGAFWERLTWFPRGQAFKFTCHKRCFAKGERRLSLVVHGIM